MLFGGCGEFGYICQIVDAHGDACAEVRQPRQSDDLGWIAHLVRHEYILDTAARENFGFRDLLAAYSNSSAELLLQAQHVDRFVHFPVRAVAHVVGPGIVAHLADVALERIEIEDQAGRLNLLFRHARNSRKVISDLKIGEFGLDVHVVILSIANTTARDRDFHSALISETHRRTETVRREPKLPATLW